MINKVQARAISKPALKKVHEILVKMNTRTNYADNGYSFYSSMLKSLTTKNDKVVLMDGRCFIAPMDSSKQIQKHTLFTLGKTELVIDNQTGQIVDYGKKPFFKPWKKIIENVEKYIDVFHQHFDNPEIVKQKRLSMDGFTEAGHKKLQEIADKVIKNRK